MWSLASALISAVYNPSILRITLKTIRGTHVCCLLQYVVIYILVRHTA